MAALVAALMAVPMAATAKDGGQHKFTADLSGAAENPAVITAASGAVKVQVKDGVLKFGLKVHNILDVTAAHIHCEAAGLNGPVGATLYMGAAGGWVSGTLAKGHIWAPDDGNGCGWVDMWDVLDALRTGDTYVNVHTSGNPTGEIRGQLG